MQRKIETANNSFERPLFVELKRPSWKFIIGRFIFWGLIIGGILPLATGIALKSYENQKTLNHYIITESFPALQSNYESCSKEYFSALTKYATMLSDLNMIQNLASKNSHFHPHNSAERESLASFLEQKNSKLRQEEAISESKISDCLNKYFIEQNKVAALLGISNDSDPTYHAATTAYSQKFNNANAALGKEVKELMSQVNLPMPNSFGDFHKVSDWLLTMFNAVTTSKPGVHTEMLTNKFAEVSVKLTEKSMAALYAKYKAFDQNYKNMVNIFYRRFRSNNETF